MTVHKNQNHKLVLILFIFLWIISSKTFAQPTVVAGQQYHYTFFSYGSPDWWYIEVENGTVVNQGNSGVPFADVVWSCAGPGLVRYVEYHETNGTSSSQENVSVTCPSMSVPATSFSYIDYCRRATIIRDSNPPPGVTWYWQVSANGTETSYGSGSTFDIYQDNVYYLRPLMNGCCWGPALATPYLSVINPGVPSTSDNSRCGAGVITLSASLGIQGDQVRWYTYSNTYITEGTIFSPNIGGTTNYYARSYNITYDCESANRLVIATVNPLPAAPTSASANPPTLCTPGPVTLSATGAGVGESYLWYLSSTGQNSITSPCWISNTTALYAGKRNDATGCEGPRTAVTVDVNPTPTTYTVSGGGSFCGSGAVALSGSQSGINYQLRKNGVDEGSVVAGTGSGLSWPGKPTGTYTVVATNSNGSCGTSMSASAVINADPITVGGSVGSSTEQYGIASGTLTLTGHTVTASILRWEEYVGSQWLSISNNTTTHNYVNISTTRQYRAIVKSGICAEAASSAATVTIYPSPAVTITGSTYVSYGTSTQLSTSSYYQYQWKKGGVDIVGATSQTLTVKEPGTYSVTVRGSATAPLITSGSATILSTLASQSVNMVSVTRILKESVTEVTSLYTLQPEEVAQGITYVDGLGRGFQSVSVGLAPTRGDIIQPTGFSKNGLRDTTFLPYVTSVGDGRLRLNAIRSGTYASSEQYQFYQNTPKVASDTYPYARTLYRNSPDAKVTEQGAPGADWQPATTHTTRNVIAFNNATYPIRYWKIDGTTSANHPNNSIMVSITTDENNNKVRTFTNALGQTLLKQVQMDETLEGVSTPWLETYFIYDQFGRLTYQIPPKAMKVLGTGASLNANNSSVSELIYKYTYDNKNRLQIKKEPTGAEQHFVYDNHDRLVFVQDGNLRSQNRWMFMKYDRYNRVAYSGVYGRNVTRATLQGEMDALNFDSVPFFEVEQVNATYHGYSNLAVPTTLTTVLTVNYYDHYDFDRNGIADYTYDNAHLAGQVSTVITAPRGLATGSKRVTINEAGAATTNWLISTVFYDKYERPVQSQNNNHLYLTVSDKSTVIYDFAGKTIQTKTTHCQSAGTCITLVDRNEYDHAGRVLKMFRKINSDPEQQVVLYEYNALGQVVDKKLHVTGGNSLQSVDYRYTIQGQLKSINNAQLVSNATNNDETNDYFGLELIYNTAESGLSNTQYYNGNISAIKWKGPGQSSGNKDQRSYKYTYDKSDRLKTSTFNAHDSIAWTKESNTLNENMTYDHNGNIKTMVRNQNQRGSIGITVTSTPQTIDNLTYTYASDRNTLTKVDDATGLTTGFKNGVTTTTEYTYNTSGSLNADNNKGVSSTTYNMLGKPQVINFTDGRKIEYTYSAAGEKLTMKTYQGTTLLTTTNYSGSFVYEGTSPVLSFFGSPEGRVIKKASSFEYEYSITDHQGNTRLVFSSATPAPIVSTANMESATNSNFLNYTNRINFELFDYTDENFPAGDGSDYSQKLTGGNNSQVGVAKSMKVYPGDKVKIEAYAKYLSQSGNSNLSGFALALTSAFGVSSSSTGEALKAYNALNNYGGIVASGGGGGSGGYPKLFVNILLFDKDYKFLDAAWQQIDGGEQVGASVKAPHDYMIKEVTVKEAGYAYIYVSHENATLVDFHIDDVVVTQTPSNIIQYNEYYPFGMQTAGSWTRENVTGNNYLYNSGSELNNVSNSYETFFRGYDPVLGRMLQVDPAASSFGNHSPYSYSFNDPIYWNDPGGAVPCMHCEEGNLVEMGGGGSAYYYGPGSGNHWSDQFSNPMRDYFLMNRNDFEAKYGINYSEVEFNNGELGYWMSDPSTTGSFADGTVTINGKRDIFVAVNSENNGSGPGDGWWDKFVNWMTECEGCEKYTKEKIAADRAANPGIYDAVDLASLFVPVGIGNQSAKLLSINNLKALRAGIAKTLTDLNKMRHIFQMKHNLTPLIKVAGSESNAVRRLYLSLGQAGGLPSAGEFVKTLKIYGYDVTVKGAVVDGIPRIATAFIPGL